MRSKNKKISVILFISSFGSGGAQRQMGYLANLLCDSYEVTLLTYHPSMQLGYMVENRKINLKYIPKKWKLDLIFMFKLYSFLRKNRQAILLSYLSTPNIYARLIGKLSGVKCVITSERNLGLLFSKKRMILEKLTLRFSDHLVVNSNAIKSVYTKKLGVDSSKVTSIVNCLDVGYYRKLNGGEIAEDLKQHFSDGIFSIVLPSRIERHKNHKCLLEALEILEEQLCGSVEILFVGNEFDKGYVEELKSFIESKNLSKLVKFVGQVRDMRSIYNLADLVVLPSLYEGFPNVVIEAMACECLVIASDVSSNSDIIFEAKDGYLFSSGHAAELAEKIAAAFYLPPEKKIGVKKNARAKVKNICGTNRFRKSYLNLFENFS